MMKPVDLAELRQKLRRSRLACDAIGKVGSVRNLNTYSAFASRSLLHVSNLFAQQNSLVFGAH